MRHGCDQLCEERSRIERYREIVGPKRTENASAAVLNASFDSLEDIPAPPFKIQPTALEQVIATLPVIKKPIDIDSESECDSKCHKKRTIKTNKKKAISSCESESEEIECEKECKKSKKGKKSVKNLKKETKTRANKSVKICTQNKCESELNLELSDSDDSFELPTRRHWRKPSPARALLFDSTSDSTSDSSCIEEYVSPKKASKKDLDDECSDVECRKEKSKKVSKKGKIELKKEKESDSDETSSDSNETFVDNEDENINKFVKVAVKCCKKAQKCCKRAKKYCKKYINTSSSSDAESDNDEEEYMKSKKCCKNDKSRKRVSKSENEDDFDDELPKPIMVNKVEKHATIAQNQRKIYEKENGKQHIYRIGTPDRAVSPSQRRQILDRIIADARADAEAENGEHSDPRTIVNPRAVSPLTHERLMSKSARKGAVKDRVIALKNAKEEARLAELKKEEEAKKAEERKAKKAAKKAEKEAKRKAEEEARKEEEEKKQRLQQYLARKPAKRTVKVYDSNSSISFIDVSSSSESSSIFCSSDESEN